MFSLKRFFSLVMALLITALAFAQSEQNVQRDPSNPRDLNDEFPDYSAPDEELVITAGRIPEEAAKVPAQVTVITAGDIAESGAASVSGVLETVAGVRFSGAMAGPGSETMSMRGFGENSYGRVLVLVDGNKLNDPDMKAANWNAISLADIERIEVLDGSAAVQYGNSAVGGVINIITKKGGQRRTILEAAGGIFFYNRESVAHFSPLSRGNFSLSAEQIETRGYRERQEAQTVNLNARGIVFIRDGLGLSVNGYASRLYFQLPGGLTRVQYDDDPRHAVNKHDQNAEWHFGGGAGIQWNPVERVELNLPLSYRGKLIAIDMASFFSNPYSDRTVHSLEARPQGSLTFDLSGMPLRLLGGVDLYYTRLNADSYSDKARTVKTNGFAISQWTAGPYLTARFSPLSNLSVSAGARFDTAVTKAAKDDGTVEGDKTHHAFVYDAGLVFNPINDAKVYARFATLFRYPFVDELAEVSGWMDHFNHDLEPEKGFNAEIGAAYRMGTMLDINANFFFMRLEDEIAYDNVISSNVNMDRTQRLGTNIGLGFRPVDFVSLDGSYSFVNAIFIDGVNKDKRVPLVPQHKVYGSVMAHLPFGLSFGPDVEYVSGCYYGQDAGNEAEIMDGYFVLGARARFVLDRGRGRFALQITAKNLLDTKYAAYGKAMYDSYTMYGPSPEWIYTLYPADGRSVNVSLQYRF